MNKFREWLSDNLRYILLGAGILAALVLIFFGIRFLSSITETGPDTKETSATPTPTPTETPEATPTPSAVPTPSDALEQNAVAPAVALINKYYTAMAAKDMNALSETVDTLSAQDEATIAAESIESYSDINVYTKTTEEPGSYVTFASYQYKLSGIDTPVPGLAQLYLKTREDGALYISTAAPGEAEQAAIDATVQSSEVQELIAGVQNRYESALNSAPALNAYFNPQSPAAPTPEATPEPTPKATPAPQATPEPTPEATPEPTPEPTPAPQETITLKSAANIRSGAGLSSPIIGSYPEGTQLVKLGMNGQWYHVSIDGVEGYISDMFF